MLDVAFVKLGNLYAVQPYPIMQNARGASFDADMAQFFGLWRPTVSNLIQGAHFHEPFWKAVVVPVHEAYQRYKRNELEGAVRAATLIEASDWRMACVQWLERRAQSRKETYK